MTIRPYRPADRDRLRQICRETAAKPFQRTGRTLEAVTLIYNDYFTAYEPDHIFVLADESDRAVGYILCATDYRGFVHRYRTTYLRRVLRTAPDQAAGLLGYLWCLGKIKNRPVHFHLDILPPYQRQGYTANGHPVPSFAGAGRRLPFLLRGQPRLRRVQNVSQIRLYRELRLRP